MNRVRLFKLALAGILAVGWIAVAHFFRHPGDTDPEPVRWALSVVGIWFFACGAWAYVHARTPLTELFLWYGALTGVHWGGAIGFGNEAWLTIELAIFFIVSTVLGQAVFLDLARRLGTSNPRFAWAPYLPTVVGVALLAGLAALPDNQALKSSLAPLYAGGALLGYIGGVLLLVRPILNRERRSENAIVAAALLISWAPYAAVAGGLIEAGGYEGFFNLPFAIYPAALAWRVTRSTVAASIA